MKKVFFLEFEKVPLQKLKKIIPLKYIQLTKNLNLDKKRQRLIKYFLIDYILKTYFLISIEDINYKEYTYSNSYYNDTLYINISNKNNIIQVAISSNKIGIDLEENIKRDFKKLLERFFTKNIFSLYEKKKEFEKDLFFYKIWTSTEAYLKMNGETLYYKDIDKHIHFPYTKTFKTNINKKEYIFSIASKDLEKEECYYFYLTKDLKLINKKNKYIKI